MNTTRTRIMIALAGFIALAGCSSGSSTASESPKTTAASRGDIKAFCRLATVDTDANYIGSEEQRTNAAARTKSALDEQVAADLASIEKYLAANVSPNDPDSQTNWPTDVQEAVQRVGSFVERNCTEGTPTS